MHAANYYDCMYAMAEMHALLRYVERATNECYLCDVATFHDRAGAFGVPTLHAAYGFWTVRWFILLGGLANDSTLSYCFKRVQAEQILALFLLHIQANTLGLPSARRSASAECVGSASLSEMAGSEVGGTELPADDVSIRVVRTLLADWSVLPGATLKSWASAMARRGVQRDHSRRSQRIASAKCQWASPARTFASFICSARAYVCVLASVPQLRGGVRAQQADTRFWFRREMNGSAMTHARPC